MVNAKALLVLMLVFTSLPSTSEAAPSGREEVQLYSAPHGFAAGPVSGVWSLGVRYLEFVPRRDERSVRFQVEDAVDLPVGARAYVDTDGDGGVDESYFFCEASKDIRVRPGGTVYVGIIIGECPNATFSVPTQGLVTATFSS